MLELMFAMAVVGIATLIQVQQMSVTLREYHIDQDTQFACRKAADMLSELQAAVDQGTIGALDELLAYANAEPSPLLTTRPVPDPGHVMSGNIVDANGAWIWWRAIDIEEVPGASHSRYVRVRVLRADVQGDRHQAAVVSGLLNITIRAEPLVQEYDVYALAIAEAPSLWQPLPTLRSELQSVVDEVSGANPNLRFRVHWITRFGYGRDPLYVPYVNETTAADQAAPWAYWYPGKLATGASASTLYAAQLLSGRVRTEAGVLHDFSALDNPYPHAVADGMNHCMRTPEAKALFALRVAAGTERIDEPPLQLLLADMAAEPTHYRNAIVLNLHGGGLPFPPLRNYSDAAKEPVGHPDVRVVTHSARLHTMKGASQPPVEFRVYAYKTTPTAGPAVLDTPITLQIFGGDFSGSIDVGRQQGGINLQTGALSNGGVLGHYSFGPAPTSPGAMQPYEMYYQCGYSTVPEPHTWLRLYNTPLSCPTDLQAGLDPAAWLYGTDYVPSPVTSIGGFYAMSNGTTADTPKNTVRWRVQLAQSALASVFGNKATITAATRIGTDLATGVMWPVAHQPSNLTTTWAWWSTDPDDVPITERYQFQGDPRHNPYLDLCGDGTAFAHGYNWWFDNFAQGGSSGSTSDWRPKWTALDTTRLRDGVNGSVVEDVPRMTQVWREALQTSHAVLVNPAGRLAGHLLLGGEIALPGVSADQALLPVTLHGALYGTSGTVAIDDLDVPGTGNVNGGRPVLCGSGGFWAKPWLGELAPDSAYAAWYADGNLATSAGFARAPRSTAALTGLPFGTSFGYAVGARLGDWGGATLLQIGTGTSTFVQSVGGFLGLATMADDAVSFSQVVGLATARISGGKLPFTWTGAPTAAPPFASHLDVYPAQTASVLEVFATSSDSGKIAAAAVRIADPGMSTHAAYFVPMAATPRTSGDHHAVMYRALVFGLRALLVAGEPGRGAEEVPLPIVRIESPEPLAAVSGASMSLRWSTRFLGFREQPYTAGYPASWAPSAANLVYVVTWRHADEPQWYYAGDDLPAVPGELPDATGLWLPDTGEGDETWQMPLPLNRFPAGEYVVRIDCFRQDASQHGAHHEVHIKVQG